MAFTAIWITLLSILLACKGSHAAECEAHSRKDHGLNINVNSVRNATGHWVSSFVAKKETNKNSGINVDVTWRFSECDEKQTVLVRGVLTDSVNRRAEERLSFHPNCGTNVAIVNNGRTVMKLRDEEPYNGVAVTNRPLKDDELFEVRLDRKISKWNYGMTIGVTTHDPQTLDIPVYMSVIKSGTWMLWEKDMLMNGTKILDNYIEHLNNLKVGDRLGIKRTEFGTLHGYINGVDKGPAASRVPENVFGFYQLLYEITAVTIVDTN